MSESSCPVSGSMAGRCPADRSASRATSRTGPRGCSFSGFSQPGDISAAFNISPEADIDEWLRARERRSINEILYADMPSADHITRVREVDSLVARDQDLLAAALGAPARQVLVRAEAIGRRTGWKDGYLSAEYGFCAPDADEAAGALATSPGRVWSDLCERMPGCVGRGRVRAAVAALPLVEGTDAFIPDRALWAAVVALGMLCSIYRYEEKNDGYDGVSTRIATAKNRLAAVPMSDDLGLELVGIPRCIGLPYWQISRRMGRAIPHLTFFDQASYNIRVRDPTSTYPYVGRFDNTDLRWPMFGERTEIAFLKGCADTSASFQHGPDAIAACQEHAMNGDIEGLLREMVRLKEILERMPNAFHSISTNPNSGDNYVSAMEWVRWGKFSAPLSKRCPAASGLQFPPYLLMDAFLGRKRYDSFLGAEGLHLRAWLPSNLRAFIAAVESCGRIPEFVKEAGDARLTGVLDGIIEAYAGERGFMGTHRYKVFGILEVASKTGRTETNGNSGGGDGTGRPWEEVHKQFSDAMRERLEPYRGDIPEPHQMRGTFEECRYLSRVLSRSRVDADPDRSMALVTLDIRDTGITFQPGDRLAVMPLNSWEECGKVVAALGLESMLDSPVALDRTWARFAEHLTSTKLNRGDGTPLSRPALTVLDVLRRGHIAPLTQQLVLKIHDWLRASSNTVLQLLATDEWPIRGTLGDLLQAAVVDTPPRVWDRAFDLSDNKLPWLVELIPVEVPRTYSISNYPGEMLPDTVDLTVSRAEYDVCAALSGDENIRRAGVGSGFLNPRVTSSDEFEHVYEEDEEILVGVSRPLTFQLPFDGAAPCAYFAGGSGIAPFRSFWQSRAVSGAMGRNILYLGVRSRDRFCYENELREYVGAGLMEVHVALSRDSRGLEYDPVRRDLVEKQTEPRYIDSLIVEQGATVCDLLMSKRQGGLGGYLYICGSVSVFDSVMSGLRRAIYEHRTATMEATDKIINAAFAERRIMLDVFMTPKPLPCNRSTIPLSQLAVNTGHRSGGRVWIGVHGGVYDVTDFAPMHPGGTLILKSNAGVDCSRTFDNLAHTNNPEVASLLTKYFVGHLTPKPDFGPDLPELGELYDLWAGYLRTTVETLVSQQFEMEDLIGGSRELWFQGDMINMLGVRIFYQYQSRLLQGGFSALFGPKFQELLLKLSFTMVNNTPNALNDLPDVLGIVSRAKTSAAAVATSKEVAIIGQYVCNSEPARFQERGIVEYARQSVSLDMDFLEDVRAEVCSGMDAFDSIMHLEAMSGARRVTALCAFLAQMLERMAHRLEVFYSKLAGHSIHRPEIEVNPARSRWELVRRCMHDGSLFALAADVSIEARPAAINPRQETVDFERVLSGVRQVLGGVSVAALRPMHLNEQHMARAQVAVDAPPAVETYENTQAVHRISAFIDTNRSALRRLSRMPTNGEQPMTLEEIMNAVMVKGEGGRGGLPTPPSSRAPSMSPGRWRASSHAAEAMMAGRKLNRRMNSSDSMTGAIQVESPPTPPAERIPRASTSMPLGSSAAVRAMVGRLNTRMSSSPSPPVRSPSVAASASSRVGTEDRGRVRQVGMEAGARDVAHRARSSTSSLRSFRLGMLAHREDGVKPTF